MLVCLFLDRYGGEGKLEKTLYLGLVTLIPCSRIDQMKVRNNEIQIETDKTMVKFLIFAYVCSREKV